MMVFSSVLAFCHLLAIAGSTPQGDQPPSAASEVPAASQVLEIRCGNRAAVWGKVYVEGPFREAVVVPISKDGSARIEGLPSGWVRIWKVHAGPIGTSPDSSRWPPEKVWCLDVPLHVKLSGDPLRLDLSPGFSIGRVCPRLPHAHASGTATLIRLAGTHGAVIVGECDVSEFFGSINFRGLRQGKYRLVLPWEKESYVSQAELHLSGTPRPIDHIQFTATWAVGPAKGKLLTADRNRLRATSFNTKVGGMVRSSSGAPIPFGQVTFVRSDLPGPWALDRRGALALGDAVEAHCDGAGFYEIRGLRPGTYLVGARPKPMQTASSLDPLLPIDFKTVQIGPGTATPGEWRIIEVSVPVTPAPTLRGRAVSGTGAPLPHAAVMFVPTDLPEPKVLDRRGALALGNAVEARCDADGSFEIQSIPRGTYLAGVWPEPTQSKGRFGLFPLIEFPPIRFDEGKAFGEGEELFETELVAAVGAVLRGQALGRVPSRLRVVARAGDGRWEVDAPVASDGSFSFGEVPRGDYWIDIPIGPYGRGLCLEAPRHAVAGGEPIELAPRPATRLRVVTTFPTARHLVGTVQVMNGSAPAGAGTIRSVPAPFRMDSKGIGIAVFTGMSPGRYRVTYRGDPIENPSEVGHTSGRFAAGWVEISRDSPQQTTVELVSSIGRKFTIFNDNVKRPISARFVDPEGALFSVEVPPATSQTVVIPLQAGGDDGRPAKPMQVAIRTGDRGEPRIFSVGNDVTSVRYPSRD